MKLFIKEKYSYKVLRKKGGRNNSGRITVRHRGGGITRRALLLTGYFQDSPSVSFVTRCLKYQKVAVQETFVDKSRTGGIAILINLRTREFFSVLSTNLIKTNYLIYNFFNFNSDKNIIFKEGDRAFLSSFPLGTKVHAVTNNIHGRIKYATAAGSFIQTFNKDSSGVLVRIPSGKIQRMGAFSKGSVGIVSNELKYLVSLKKAGQTRNLGIRPTVRGVAMNPVDHPHGGGEGKSHIGRHPVTPWGIKTKGYKTKL